MSSTISHLEPMKLFYFDVSDAVQLSFDMSILRPRLGPQTKGNEILSCRSASYLSLAKGTECCVVATSARYD